MAVALLGGEHKKIAGLKGKAACDVSLSALDAPNQPMPTYELGSIRHES